MSSNMFARAMLPASDSDPLLQSPCQTASYHHSTIETSSSLNGCRNTPSCTRLQTSSFCRFLIETEPFRSVYRPCTVTPDLSAISLIVHSSQTPMEAHNFTNPFFSETAFYNRIVLGALLPDQAWRPLPHFFQTWLRNYIGGTLLYFISGFLWCFYIYYWKKNVYLPKGLAFIIS
uniref:Uncharacterized protein n=1 Tax=Kalanchoe fedtschenkoi TaxID=63787 RepID=A0A7N0ZZF3_KALFE